MDYQATHLRSLGPIRCICYDFVPFTTRDIFRLKAILHYTVFKACRYDYLPTDFLSLDDLPDASDDSLFSFTRYNPQHVLHQLLPPPKQTFYNLRSRGHGLTLSDIPSEFMRKNFLHRMLHKDTLI